jgi:uncharacterized protein Yka (UPF0111/DUF47 family)
VTEKLSIIGALGESALLLPARVNAALAANDRVKFLLTLLQTARQQVDHPARQVQNLHAERLASGVEDESLDAVIAGAGAAGRGTYHMPQARTIVGRVFEETRRMVDPLADDLGGARLRARLDALAAMVGTTADEEIVATTIDRLTSGSRGEGDSVHLVVMDAHKALNALQAGLASEKIDGASAYGVAPGDRQHIHSFMRGVHRTETLKLEHPGLSATATRLGDRLVIQNDIGATDAHVLVLHVEGMNATVIYTDVHLPRLLFFESLFDHFPVRWEDARSRSDPAFEEGVFHLGVGSFHGETEADVDAFLEFLGSRLVFLIDWNRARKRLRDFIPNNEAIKLLRWAADEDIGHMAFLVAGGERLVFDAIDFATKGEFPVGASLHEVLGLANARQFLRFVLRTAAELLLHGEPVSHVRDAVQAELLNYFQSRRQDLFDIAIEHAAWMFEIADGVRAGLLGRRAANSEALRQKAAQRAKKWERRADECVIRARDAVRNAEGGDFLRSLIESADDVADELEEAAFHATLFAEPERDGLLVPPVERLSELVVQGVQEYIKALEIARHVRRGGAREDMQDFLDAVHQLVALERRSDEAEREVEVVAAREAPDFRTLHFILEAAQNLEQAADGLLHCGLRLRDDVLSEVLRT